MKVDRPVACLLGVKIDFPELPERIRLDEVTFVVDVESVVDRMTLQVGDESGDIDNGQRNSLLRFPRVATPERGVGAGRHFRHYRPL